MDYYSTKKIKSKFWFTNKENKNRCDYLDAIKQINNLTLKNELRFTPPIQIFRALKQALNELMVETVSGRIKRYTENYNLLKIIVKKYFTLYTNQLNESKILMAINEPNDFSFEHFHNFMKQNGIIIYPGKVKSKTFRLSILGDLCQEDILFFGEKLDEYFISNVKNF